MATCISLISEYEKPQHDPLLRALAYVETRNQKHLVGKAGERSAYQITRVTWQTYTKACFCAKHAENDEFAASIAYAHLAWLSKQYHKKTKQYPNPMDLYLLWNMGLRGYERCDFNIDKVAPWRRKKAMQFYERIRIYNGNN